MFCVLFGWRNASKCKKLIKLAINRLDLLKKKRYSIVKQCREDLLELIDNGYQQTAFDRVEELIRDERLIEAYDLIEKFCELILVKFSYIRKHKTCPDDIMEAISSLIFASARCGDFPELKLIRKLFEKRYGRSFATAAVELSQGNLMNSQIKEKLLMKCNLEHEKQNLMSEIIRDWFHPAILALEYCPDWHKKQVLENDAEEELEREVISVYSSRDSSSDVVDPRCRSTISSPLVCQSYYPNVNEEVCSNNSALASLDFLSSLDRENNDALSSPEFLTFREETIVYFDDIVELSNPSTKDGDLWDQRFFKFKSPVDGSRKRSGCRERENHSFLSHTKKKFSLEQQCYVYSKCRNENYEVMILEKTKTDSYHIQSSTSTDNRLGNDLSSIDRHQNKDLVSWNNGDLDEEIEFDTYAGTKRIRSYEIGTVVYDVFVYSHCQPSENNESSLCFTECMKAADKYPRHVHPKLPDYDEIEAKFIDLKIEYLQQRKQQHQINERKMYSITF